MFIDSDRLSRAELEALAACLPGPHAWTHGTADIFYCQACHTSFEFDTDPVPQGPCDAVDMLAGAIFIDELPLAEFVARHGRSSEAERRIGESFSAVLDRDVEATIDAAGTVQSASGCPMPDGGDLLELFDPNVAFSTPERDGVGCARPAGRWRTSRPRVHRPRQRPATAQLLAELRHRRRSAGRRTGQSAADRASGSAWRRGSGRDRRSSRNDLPPPDRTRARRRRRRETDGTASNAAKPMPMTLPLPEASSA